MNCAVLTAPSRRDGTEGYLFVTEQNDVEHDGTKSEHEQLALVARTVLQNRTKCGFLTSLLEAECNRC